ncbi:hypothetical protein SteCoe_36623 [Stentor coeruleus]|uniref:TRP C-terminal domain-containing protein n=1 Tax=Stentor coeruleus TaxID=5963 RepID=A0A1R2APU0_9CILI|nr:hypothetical protein SteCoe_36623 [Stentor coeruleus]
MFTVFSCTYIEGDGTYMKDNLIIKCWTGNHLKYSMAVALPSIIIWAVGGLIIGAVGVPTIVLIIMSKRRVYLKNESNKVIFGFLFNGYKQSRFFWEFSIMYRKIVIICISVFMNQTAQAIQALTLIIILAITLYLQYEYKPYNKHQLNHMEMEAILTATITIYCGMYYLTQEIGEGFGIALFIIMLCGNMYFVIYWLYFMFQAIIDLLSGFLPFFRKIIGKSDPYPKIIFSEKKIHQGVYKDNEEGVNSFTLIEKSQLKDQKLFRLEEGGNMHELHFGVCKRYVDKVYIMFFEISVVKNKFFDKEEYKKTDNDY